MKKILILLMLMFVLFGCDDQIDERYDRDPQFGESLYSALESKGVYKLFLKAVDSAGLARSLKGRGIHSVMAPTDEVFNAYLQKRGLTSISGLRADELKAIVEIHIVDKPFSREMVGEFMENVPMRLHTMYQSPTVGQDIPGFGDDLLIYTGKKLMPIFTPENWEKQKINDIAYNYDYFFENKWQSGKWKYGEATVDSEVEQIGNGFIYKVDQILEPPMNLEKYLIKDGDASKYKTLMKLFESDLRLLYRGALSEQYGGDNKDSVFLKFYSRDPVVLVEIASEFILSTDDLFYYPMPMEGHQTLLAPNDKALDKFINDNLINEHWRNFNEIPMFNKAMLLSNLCMEEYAWPEKIDDGLTLGTFSIPVNFSTQNDVEEKYLSSNGIFYGLNKMPDMMLYRSVVQELMTNPDYNNMAHMLLQSNYLGSVANKFQDYTFLLATDESWEEVGLEFTAQDLDKLGDERLWYMNYALEEEDQEVFASQGTIANFVGNHILVGKGFDLTEGYKLYETINRFGVVLTEKVYDDAQNLLGYGISSDGLMESGSPALIEGEMIPADNGEYIKISKPLSFGTTSIGNTFNRYSEQKFITLMKDADILVENEYNKTWSIRSLVGGARTVFIPTDEAMQEAIENEFFPVKPEEFDTDTKPDKPANHAPQEEKDKYEADLEDYLERKATADHKMKLYRMEIEKFVKNHIVPMAPSQRVQYFLPNKNLDQRLNYDIKLHSDADKEYVLGVHVVMKDDVNTVSNISRTESANIILDKDIVIASGALIYKIDKVIDFNK